MDYSTKTKGELVLFKGVVVMNAKTEFLDAINLTDSPVLCAQICMDEWNIYKNLRLPLSYTSEQWDKFLEELDFTYDDGYGSQEVFGTIWFLDGTWAEREEYDGSEWWVHRKCPEIPKELHSPTEKE